MTVWFTHVITCDLFLIYSFKNKSIFLLHRKIIINVSCFKSKICLHIWLPLMKIANGLKWWKHYFHWKFTNFKKHWNLIIVHIYGYMGESMWVNKWEWNKIIFLRNIIFLIKLSMPFRKTKQAAVCPWLI